MLSSVIGTRIAAVVALVALCAGVVPASAQVVGANLSGTVLDQSKAALPGVTVTIRNTATGREQVLVSDDAGRFRAVALQPGPYEITAELAGFGTAKRGVTLVIGGDVRADLEMGVATLQETVTVSGAAPIIEVTKSAPSTTIVSDQIQALPVLERNFLSLAQMMPGAAPNYTSKFSRVKFGGPADQRNGYTTIVDGGDLDDAIWGDPTVNISQDAVQEFKVFRNQFDAQYGAALAAVVTVVTRSGTNDLAGTGYFFGRDDAMNAKNAFQRSKPVYEQQRTGGSIGGPIFRNRTHFFAAYEFNHVDNQKIIALPASNPFAARENGEFAAGSREHMAWPSSTTASPTAPRRSCATPSTTSGRPAPATPARTAPTSTTRARCTALIGEQSWVHLQHHGQHPARPLHVERGGDAAGVVRARRGAAVGDDRPELHRAAVLPAHAAAAVRDVLHDQGPPRHQDGRRLHLRQAHLRRPLLRERAVAVRHRRGVQRQQHRHLTRSRS